MWEAEDYDQNKHQNLGLTYCCLTQINSSPVNYLGTNKIIISNDYRQQELQSVHASPHQLKHEGTGKLLV